MGLFPKSLSICITAGLVAAQLGYVTARAQSAAPNLRTQSPSPQNDKPTLPDGPRPNPPSAAQQPVVVNPSFEATAGSSSSSTLLPGVAEPKYWKSSNPNAQVTVREDTLFRVLTDQPLSSRHSSAGTGARFTLSEDVFVDDTLIIPKGATLYGAIVESKHAGTLTGSPELILKLTSLELAGRTYPLYTYHFKVVGSSKTRPTETKVRGGAIIGALAGGVFSGSATGVTTAIGRLAGIGTGAALGAGAGAIASAATPGPIVSIPAESQMDFYLSSPISVVPASKQLALKLRQGMNRGGPVLYIRSEAP